MYVQSCWFLLLAVKWFSLFIVRVTIARKVCIISLLDCAFIFPHEVLKSRYNLFSYGTYFSFHFLISSLSKFSFFRFPLLFLPSILICLFLLYFSSIFLFLSFLFISFSFSFLFSFFTLQLLGPRSPRSFCSLSRGWWAPLASVWSRVPWPPRLEFLRRSS